MYRTGDLFRPKSSTHHESQFAPHCLREYQALQKSGISDPQGSDPVQLLRLLCLSRGANGMLNMGRMFRRMDDDGNRQLTKNEFVAEGELAETGLELSHEELGRLFDKFDDDTDGTFNMTDFLVHVRPPMSATRKIVVEKAFDKADKRGHRDITMGELKRVYSVQSRPRYISGEESEESIVKRFLANFEDKYTTDGKVNLEEFMDYYSAISAEIDTDTYFDLMMRQAYKL